MRRRLLGIEVTEAPDLHPVERRATLTVAELAARYLTYAADCHSKDGKPTPECGKVASDLRGVQGRNGEVPAGEFGPLCLEDVRDRVIDAGLARTTINDPTRRIVAMFKWAAPRELVPPSVHHGLTRVSGLRAGRSKAPEPVPVRPVDDAVWTPQSALDRSCRPRGPATTPSAPASISRSFEYQSSRSS